MRTKKKFDCVEMKDKAQEMIQARIVGMTPEEEVAYWASGTERLRAKQKAILEQRKASMPISAPLQESDAEPIFEILPTRQKKEFDCVEMKDKIQAELQKKMAVMTPEEESAYWNRRNKELREEVEALRGLRKAS